MLATVLAYAVAYLAFGYLTTVTSFLVSFVMGNGTNYAVVLLARYEDERRQGEPVQAGREACLLGAVADHRHRRPGLRDQLRRRCMITSFRGFSQFGLIGAAGCLLAWADDLHGDAGACCACSTAVAPPPRAARRAASGLLGAGWGSFIERRPAPVLATGAVITLLMVVGSARLGGTRSNTISAS